LTLVKGVVRKTFTTGRHQTETGNVACRMYDAHTTGIM